MSKNIIRSPSYPSIALDAAVIAAGKIEARYRSAAVDRKNAAKLIGFSALSGPANKALAALAAYGLLERAGKGDTRVTDRARAILHPRSPDERRENLIDAATAPPLFQNLRERYPDIPVPPEDGVLTYLNRQNFNPNYVRQASKAFIRTAEFLQEQGVSDSHAKEPSDDGKLPSAGQDDGAHGGVRIGDVVQWDSAGVYQLSYPCRVRAISDDGKWAFVEGSETGIPMNEVKVEQRPEAQVTPPKLALSEAPVLREEIEWLRSRVGKNTSVRLLVNGEIGTGELKRLIRIIQAQLDVLVEDDEIRDEYNA